MSALSTEFLWVIPFSILLGGFMGSPHCLLMCGPIAFNYSKNKITLIYYQLGRVISYCLAGAICGQLGETLFMHSGSVWVSNLSLLIIGLLLVVTGYRMFTNKPLHLPIPLFFSKYSMVIWRLVNRKGLPFHFVAGISGFFTVFLPCGHLYSFLIGAMATGTAVKGAIFMFAFWLGTVPILSLSGLWLHKLIKPTTISGQRWAGILLLMGGLFSVGSFGAKSEYLFKQIQKPKETVSQQQTLCH